MNWFNTVLLVNIYFGKYDRFRFNACMLRDTDLRRPQKKKTYP